jgi:hypothetical protein
MIPLEANDKASLRFQLIVLKEGRTGVMAAPPLTAEEIAAANAEADAEEAAAAAGGAGAAGAGAATPVTN